MHLSGWHRLGWLALLCGAMLLCAAEPQSNRPSQRDARKLRYADRQEQPAGETSASASRAASETPLSLLPQGAESAPQAAAPNALPQPGELDGGVTAATQLPAPAQSSQSGSFAAVVRSVTRDGRAFGESRVGTLPVGEELFIPDQPVRAEAQVPPVTQSQSKPQPQSLPGRTLGASGLPSLRGGAPIPGEHRAAPVVAAAEPPKQQPAIQPLRAQAEPRPTAAVTKPVAVPTKPATTKPANVPAKPAAQTPLRAQSEPPAATTETPANRAVGPIESATGFEWLSRALSGEQPHSEPALEHLSTPQTPLLAQTAEIVEGDELAALGALSIPEGEVQPRRGIDSTVARWLLGLSGVCVLGLIILALPKPRRVNGDELRIIESIELDGRRLILAEKKHYALVLGDTERSVHLLEKVAMHRLSGDYQSTIAEIVARESALPVELWRMRPVFTSLLAPQYAPEAAAARSSHTSIAELRSQLEVLPARETARPATVRRTKMSHVELVEPEQSEQLAAAVHREPAVQRASEPDRYGERVPVALLPRPEVPAAPRRYSVEREAVKSRLRERARLHLRAS